MLLSSYLRRSRHGIYYFRVVLPDPVARVLDQREFVRSPALRSPKIAKNSGYKSSCGSAPLIERLRTVMAIDPNSIDPEDVRTFIAKVMDLRPDGGAFVDTERIQYRKGRWNDWTTKNTDRDDKAEERRQKREAAKAAKAAEASS